MYTTVYPQECCHLIFLVFPTLLAPQHCNSLVIKYNSLPLTCSLIDDTHAVVLKFNSLSNVFEALFTLLADTKRLLTAGCTYLLDE